jgi:hypothetical protein
MKYGELIHNNIIIPSRMLDRFTYLRMVMLADFGIDISIKTRHRILVVGRTLVAHVLLTDGYTPSQIGFVMGVDRCTVIHYKELMEDFFRSPGYEGEREMWEKFKNEIQ